MDECNKEEAQKALQIAERKFFSHDLKSAKKLAIKAQTLFPSLETSQLISTLDVYLSSENRYGNESDWYGILNLPPFSDEETVKKQYRKLALHLHPDKNKSFGAEGAFKLISQAWSVLSDTNSKTKYDVKRKKNENNNNNTAISSSSVKTKRKNKTKTGTGTGTIRTGVDTFWTSCNRCRMQYEYLRVYLNHNLLCPNCHNAFMAVETGFPLNGNSNPGLGTGNSNPGFQWETTQTTKSVSNKANRRKREEANNANANANYTYNYEYNYGNNNDHNVSSNYNFEYNSGGNASGNNNNNSNNNYNFGSEKPAVKRPGRPPKRRRYSFGETSYNSGINTGISTGTGIERPVQDSEIPNGFAQMSNNTNINNNGNINNNYGGNYVNNSSSRMPYKRNSFRDLSQADIRNILMEKARDTISKNLAQFHISNPKETQNESPMEEDSTNNNVGNYDLALANNDSRKVVKVVGQPASISVPDPDFYDFDKDRTEKSFEGDQVWATYDSEDGMPRLYTLVQKILTKKPFSIRMSFLNSKSNQELGPINWVGSGFTKTCGDFRVGRYQVTDTANIFSHRVLFEKGPRGIIKIVPRKGETWALYKNWDPNWNELTPDETIYKYEIVEVLSDFDGDNGIRVIPLVKVAGFKAVFHRHMEEREIRVIPKEEMFRFSHGIPSRVLNGDEGENAPKGCHELDPAATPLELLKVINE
ncbi:hypothetical protein LUZ60_004824 [Juncus effusus]|nr:hypothetical protein LUZ60_004824 [Juncus effusus]